MRALPNAVESPLNPCSWQEVAIWQTLHWERTTLFDCRPRETTHSVKPPFVVYMHWILPTPLKPIFLEEWFEKLNWVVQMIFLYLSLTLLLDKYLKTDWRKKNATSFVQIYICILNLFIVGIDNLKGKWSEVDNNGIWSVLYRIINWDFYNRLSLLC